MTDSERFLRLMKDNNYDAAAKLVLQVLNHQKRVESFYLFIVNTFTVHKAGIRVLTKAVDDYIRHGDRTGAESLIWEYQWHDWNVFESIVRCFLKDLLRNNYDHALEIINLLAKSSKEKQVKQFLYELSAIAWPEKGLIGAIYS